MKTGDLIEFSEIAPITKEQLRAYADASGDHNPIHLDEQIAKSAGLPGIIAHGMLTAGLIANRASRYMREEAGAPEFRQFRWMSFQTRFKAMTLLGDVIAIGGLVKEASDATVTLELQARNQKNEVTTTGEAIFARK